MKKFLKYRNFIILLAIIIAANILGKYAFFRIDLTPTKSYSLSEASKKLVSNLSSPLKVHVFFSDNLPAPYNTNAQYVRDILSEYRGKAKGNFSYEFYDMNNPDNETKASEYGLRRIQIQELKNNEVGFKQVWMGMALTYGEAVQTIDALTSTGGLEYKLTTSMSRMISVSDIISKLPESDNLNLTLYMTDELSQFNINGFNETKEIVETAFKNINETHKGKINFAHIDPSQKEIDEIVTKYGIQKLEWNNGGETKKAVIGLVISHNDNFKVIPLSMQQSIFGYVMVGLENMEQEINGNIESLFSKVTQIGYVTGHGEASIYDSNMTGAATLNSLVSDTYNFTEINLAESEIPSGISSIVINGAKSEFSETELYKIDQFIMRGGNAIFFDDPFMEFGGNEYYGQAPIFFPTATGLEKLLSAYGVTVQKNYVMDEDSYFTMNEQYGKLYLYWAPLIQQKQLAKKHPITDNLGVTIFLQSGAIDIDENALGNDAKATVIARSSPRSWTVSENIQLNPLMMFAPENKDELSEKNLAVILEGKFKSAFDAAPAEEASASGGSASGSDSASGGKAASFSSVSHIQNSTQAGKIFVAGTSLITSPQLIDNAGTEPSSIFIRNIIDYMNGNEELCPMRTKGLSFSMLENTGTAAAGIAQIFNQFGLAVLVAIAGLIVWRLRNKHRKEIRLRYNPNDEREK